MKNLEALIKRARIAYYNGKPLMSDEAYDRLEEQLGVATEVGHDVLKDRGARYPHAFPMYSLQKAYSVEDHPDYGNEPVTVTPKLDGAAVSLQYIRGEVITCLNTRRWQTWSRHHRQYEVSRYLAF